LREYQILKIIKINGQPALILREAGVSVITKRFDGIIHGFLQFFVNQEEVMEVLDLITTFTHEKLLTRSK